MSVSKFKKLDVIRITEDAKLPIRQGKFFLVTRVMKYSDLYEEAKAKLDYLGIDDDTPIYFCFEPSGRRHFIPEYYRKNGLITDKKTVCVEYATPEQEAIMICCSCVKHILNSIRERDPKNDRRNEVRDVEEE